jgi:hypothetical protein
MRSLILYWPAGHPCKAVGYRCRLLSVYSVCFTVTVSVCVKEEELLLSSDDCSSEPVLLKA